MIAWSTEPGRKGVRLGSTQEGGKEKFRLGSLFFVFVKWYTTLSTKSKR